MADIQEKRKRAIESGDYPELDEKIEVSGFGVADQVTLTENYDEEGFEEGENGFILGFGWKDPLGNKYALVEIPGTDPAWLPIGLLSVVS